MARQPLASLRGLVKLRDFFANNIIYGQSMKYSTHKGDNDESEVSKDPSKSTHTESPMNISDMRKTYRSKNEIFDTPDLVSKEPFKQFLAWFEEASKTDGIRESNAMALATSTKDGIPSVRMVLMKGIDDTGIYFYTNYFSQKAKELEQNPNCSLMFYWEPLNRSVRICGKAERISVQESTDYFHSRPKASQIGACVSLQSKVISERKVLDDRNEELTNKYASPEESIPKPDYWGGYKVIPSRFEFWQGQTNRLHDRIVFRKLQPDEEINSETTHKGLNEWVYERLMP